jgi:hypothetical protein
MPAMNLTRLETELRVTLPERTGRDVLRRLRERVLAPTA